MYRINFYPEFAENRLRGRRNAARRTAVLALVTVEVLLAFSLALSGVLLNEQARTLRTAIERLSSRVESTPSAHPEIALAGEVLELRAGRVDWSPALAAIATNVGTSMRLERVSGSAAWRKSPATLSIEGRVDRDRTSVEDVSAFMEALREDRRIARVFPSVTLGVLKGGSDSEFEISCRATPAGRDGG